MVNRSGNVQNTHDVAPTRHGATMDVNRECPILPTLPDVGAHRQGS